MFFENERKKEADNSSEACTDGTEDTESSNLPSDKLRIGVDQAISHALQALAIECLAI